MTYPLYLRGFDRARAEELARLFMRSYQPPIDCAHRWSKWMRDLAGVRGLRWRRCSDCQMVEGLLA